MDLAQGGEYSGPGTLSHPNNLINRRKYLMKKINHHLCPHGSGPYIQINQHAMRAIDDKISLLLGAIRRACALHVFMAADE